ncbi:MAG: chromate efflux transporter [Gammaproteobacteria bacterium]
MTEPQQATPASTAAPAPVSFREALGWWTKLGFISFGGPAGQIAIMHRELVEKRRWISERRFLHALNYCMVLPGPEAQQLATYIGYLLHGTKGAIAAGVLFVLPSLLILAALSWLYLAFGHVAAVQDVLWAVKPAVVAIVLHAAWRIGSRTLKHPLLAGIALAAFLALALADAPFPLVIAGAALTGVIAHRVAPLAFAATGGHGGATSAPHAPALIDDHTPVPPHARYRSGALVKTVAVFLLLWLGTMALLVAGGGWQSTLAQMGLFFSQAALLTFGGAYAVLPYVTDAAVNHYHWATTAQMLDGLALGETTSGPLIMIVAFVGFVGGWTQQLHEITVLGALAGAGVATFFTFLPSFLFILAGVPLVEATRHDLRIGAPLLAITAAVVGVILHLALFFAQHVFWPASTPAAQGAPDPGAMAIATIAFIALWRFDQSVLRVIGACALAGLAVAC